MANIGSPLFIVELSNVSEFSAVEKANLYCDVLHCTGLECKPFSEESYITTHENG